MSCRSVTRTLASMAVALLSCVAMAAQSGSSSAADADLPTAKQDAEATSQDARGEDPAPDPVDATTVSEIDSRLVICDENAPPVAGAGVTSVLEPDSPPAREIRELGFLVLGICAAIFIVVQGLLVVAIVRGARARRAAEKAGDTSEPVQLHGSIPIEVAWTVIPIIIVFVLTLVTIRTIRDIDLTEAPDGAMEVVVIGHQWWWEFRYPDPDGDPGAEVVTANEMHVPAGRPIWLRLESADVIHSFWVPRLAGKTDLIPGRTNHTWFEAERPGLYLGQCAEYCGTQHAHMLLRVYAHEPEDFDRWLTSQRGPTVDEPSVARGRRVFMEYACMNCHTIAGTSDGMFGPNLSKLATRDTIGSGFIPLDRENLKAWIDDPQALKPGCNMPALKLDDQELDDVVDYLMTLR
ncbi:MAG: cytochrome c oxidase subunit II [Planctomycetota bacterium]|nr:cytochrome c oxidase subunit II [Planctomycetota bacterium]